MFKRLTSFLTRQRIKDKTALLSGLEHAKENHIINNAEYQIIHNSLQARDRSIEQAMLAKAETITVSDQAHLSDILTVYYESKHSRYPVIDDQDNVLGIILMKDLIPFITEPNGFNLLSALRPAHFAPQSQAILSLLQQMQHTHQHMTIVMDEYGNFSGIITIEDLIEQIVGNIEDEHDMAHPEYIQKISANTFRISGRTPIEQFNQYFQCEFSLKDFDTISGILSQAFGHIPQKGESIQLQGLHFTVHSASPSTIERIHLKRLSE